MSFSLTTDQIRNRTKTVTRRLGWGFLKPGDIVNACVKCMGLKPGEKVERICQIRIVSVRREPLNKISFDRHSRKYGRSEVAKEGFPEMHPHEFVSMFCRNMRVLPMDEVNRIEFEYVETASVS